MLDVEDRLRNALRHRCIGSEDTDPSRSRHRPSRLRNDGNEAVRLVTRPVSPVTSGAPARSNVLDALVNAPRPSVRDVRVDGHGVTLRAEGILHDMAKAILRVPYNVRTWSRSVPLTPFRLNRPT